MGGSESGIDDYPSPSTTQVNPPTSAGSSQGAIHPWGRGSGSQETTDDGDIEEEGWDEPLTPAASQGGKYMEDDDEYDFFSDDDSSLGGESRRSGASAAAGSVGAKWSPPRSRAGSRETGWIDSPYSPTAERRGRRRGEDVPVVGDADADVSVDLKSLHIAPVSLVPFLGIMTVYLL